MSNTLALIVVQRHSAASKSARPWITGQHLSFVSWPMTACTSPPSRSTHASSLRVSMGHAPDDGVLGDGGDGVLGDGGTGPTLRGGGGHGDGGGGGGGDFLGGVVGVEQ